jgi:hypothetical protein
MPSVSRTIYYLEKSEGFGELIPNGLVVPMDPTVVIFKGVYLAQSEITPDGLGKGKLGLSLNLAHTLLRPVRSSDGPPSWSAIVYRQADNMTVRVREELPASRTLDRIKPENAVCYHADPPGGFAWESDISSGKSGYFLTGGSGPNALWRIIRIQADALNRQVLTLAPVQLTPTLALPSFEKVRPELRNFLTQHFEGFQQAVTRNAHLDAIDRANNLAEGIMSHCLNLADVPPPETLFKRLETAKKILEDKSKRKGFPLTQYAYHLAHQIRILHQRLHENQTGKTPRPEVGMNLTVTVSELLVEIGLGKY